ncbi:MAG: hypothetical protein K2J80_05795 [Oscillospiraceae bacterium]|nr:hypothetical protein [Oscillospiraceae bacterium]
MIIEIEYYKGDVKLHGKRLDARSLKRLLKSAESVCSDAGDGGDLAETLCVYFGFERIAANMLPDWVYDRDTGMLYAPERGNRYDTV